MSATSQPDPRLEISRAVARIKAGILAMIFGLLSGGGLFLMTLWLVIKGGPRVGAHLELLGHYFPGYRVTYGGAFLGFIYGMVVGALVGWTIGTVYNRIVGLRYR